LESITDAFFTLDTEWRFTYANSQAERLLQRPRADLLGRNVWEQFPPEGAAYGREYRRAVDEQVAVSFENFYPPFDSWFEIRAYPSAEGLSVYFRDITERKTVEEERRRSEEALRQSEERYRLLVEGAKDYAMILLDKDGRITSWNTGRSGSWGGPRPRCWAGPPT